MTYPIEPSSSKGSLVLSINSNSNSNNNINNNKGKKTMIKKYEPTVYYYTHFIESFIADTYHLGAIEKYAYLTMIWEAHRKRGVVSNKSLESLYKKNKDIPKEVYSSVIFEFWDVDDEGNYTNNKVTSDMNVTKLHRNTSSKGGKTSSLQKMIDSDQRIDEYNQIHDSYPSKRRVARQEGLSLYCKQLQDDKRMTFKRIMEVVKGFDCQPQYYPMLDTLLRDTQGKYWKVEQEPSSEDKLEYVSRAIKWLTENNYNWGNLTERNDLIKQHYKESV